MPSPTSPIASHFHPYRQVSESHWQSSLAYFGYPYAHAEASYWTPETKAKSTRTRRYSVGCTQAATEFIQHKSLYYTEPPRSNRARRPSRGQIYEVPPTPWMRTVPLPLFDDVTSLHSLSKGHSKTASIDSAGSWSPDQSFLQKHISLPKYADDDVAPSKIFPKAISAGPIVIPELAKLETRLKWDVRNQPHGASFSTPGAMFARPDLKVPALSSEIRSVSISFDAPRADAFKKDWGCILVRARLTPLRNAKNSDKERRYEMISVFDLMEAIFKYFNEKLTSDEIAKSCYSSSAEALLKRIGAARLVYTGHSKEGDRYRRVDLLDDFRFLSLKVDTTSGNWSHLHLRLK